MALKMLEALCKAIGIAFFMRRQFSKTLAVAPLALFAGLILFQPRALADVSLTLSGLQTGFSMGGVYTSPYLISVNGQPTLMFACDDFTTDISMFYTWTATRVNLSDVLAITGPQKFKTAVDVSIPDPTTGLATTHSYTIQQEYNAAAYLAEQLLTDSSILSSSPTAGEYSFAIWQIFDSGAVNGYNGNALTNDQKKAVGSFMTTAFSSTSSLTGMYLYTPVPSTPSQEFIGLDPLSIASVPEAPTPVLLAFNSLALSGVLFLLRRRSLRTS
jgi:hypothetical protein